MCSSPEEHAKLVERVERSTKEDYDRNSNRVKSAPTTQTIRARVLAKGNGRSSHTL